MPVEERRPRFVVTHCRARQRATRNFRGDSVRTHQLASFCLQSAATRAFRVATASRKRDDIPMSWNTPLVCIFPALGLLTSHRCYSTENDFPAIKAQVGKRHDEAVKRLQDWIKLPSISAEDHRIPDVPG